MTMESTRNGKARLIVYLDSSDISVLAKPPPADKDAVTQVHKKLLELANDGRVVFPISMLHMLEILHMRPEFKESASQRARIAKELSGGVALRWVSDVFVDDAFTLLELERRAPKDYAISDTGNWLPSAIERKFDFVRELRNDLRKRLVETASSRSERRMLDKKLFRQHTLRTEAIPLVKKALESMYVDLRESFPLTDRFYSQDFLLQLLVKRKTEGEICDELRRGLCDPEFFVTWYVDLLDPKRSVVGSMRQVAQDVAGQINSVRNMVRLKGLSESESRTIASEFKLDTDEFRARLAKSMFTKYREVIKQNGVHSHKWEKLVLNSKRGELLGIDAFLDIIGLSYLEDITTHSKSRDVRDSFVVDWLHGIYLPYVHLLRADRAAAHRLKAAVPKYKEQVVSRLVMLPDAIRTKLSHLR